MMYSEYFRDIQCQYSNEYLEIALTCNVSLQRCNYFVGVLAIRRQELPVVLVAVAPVIMTKEPEAGPKWGGGLFIKDHNCHLWLIPPN